VTDAKDTLCRGIALHTFMDTYSHETFSGRHSPENHVGCERWKSTPSDAYHTKWLEVSDLLLPDIGHAQVQTDPDQSHLTIWLGDGDYGPRLERCNADQFLVGLIHAYYLLGGTESAGTPLHTKLHDLLAAPGTLAEKCARWSDVFSIPPYDPTAWRTEALTATSVGDFYASPWYRWHMAAMHQQHAVLEGTS
jgi:hypothetical protein